MQAVLIVMLFFRGFIAVSYLLDRTVGGQEPPSPYSLIGAFREAAVERKGMKTLSNRSKEPPMILAYLFVRKRGKLSICSRVYFVR